MAFLEKRIPPRIFNRVRDWMEHHAILAVALPAILPPPMPLSPFVLAAGALKMSKKTFMTTFTISRAARHSIAAWLGIHYGRHILRLWNHLSASTPRPSSSSSGPQSSSAAPSAFGSSTRPLATSPSGLRASKAAPKPQPSYVQSDESGTSLLGTPRLQP